MSRKKNVEIANRNTKSCECVCCGETKGYGDKTFGTSAFYMSLNPIHKNGIIPYCKDCIKAMVLDSEGNFSLELFKNMLQITDKPFIQKLFDSSLRNSKDDITKLTGYYWKNLQFAQYKLLTWKNSDIDINDATVSANINANITSATTIDLNKINKTYSKKWMGEYTETDIDYLDAYLRGLHNDFKITTENHKDYAKKIAKASLHMDKCFQEMCNGVQGADKKYKDARETFDTLSKSAQFSESQRGQNDVGLGCYGVVFEKVEKNRWIYQHIPLEDDAIDKLLKQFGHINKSI